MNGELLSESELDKVVGGANLDSQTPEWIEEKKRELNQMELSPVNEGGFFQRLKGIFQRMQLD